MDQNDLDPTRSDDRDHALEDEFWGHEPTRRFERPAREPRPTRLARAARSARDPRPAETVVPANDPAADPFRDRVTDRLNDTVPPDLVTPCPRPPVDPLLRRAGLLALAIGLLVPVALSIRGGAASGVATGSATVAYGSAPGVTDTAAPASADTIDYPMVGPLESTDLPTITPPGDANDTPDEAQSTPPARTERAQATVSCASRYDVRSGDSWSLIASRASVTLDRLLAANSATVSTVLLVGAQICLPPEAKVSALTAAGSAGTTGSKTSVSAPATTWAPPPTNTYSREQVIRIIREEWPDALEDTAIMIADRESHLNPSAQNWCCVGLFQIYWDVHDGWLAALGITNRSQMFDPRTSARAGYALYLRSNSFRPWGL